MSLFITSNGDGSYALTGSGVVLTVVLLVLLLVLSAFFRKKSKPFSAKQLAFSAIAIALAYAASYIKLIHMPWGGSVTLFSMLFVVLVGYWFGPSVGLCAAFSYGLLQFLQGGSYILSPLQAGLDYVLAFTALGVSGFFTGKKHGLSIGYIVAVLLRGLLHSIGGYLYWMDYMPENFPQSLAAVYPLLYNYAYIGVEAVLTLILINIPAVKKGLEKVTELARN